MTGSRKCRFHHVSDLCDVMPVDLETVEYKFIVKSDDDRNGIPAWEWGKNHLVRLIFEMSVLSVCFS